MLHSYPNSCRLCWSIKSRDGNHDLDMNDGTPKYQLLPPNRTRCEGKKEPEGWQNRQAEGSSLLLARIPALTIASESFSLGCRIEATAGCSGMFLKSKVSGNKALMNIYF